MKRHDVIAVEGLVVDCIVGIFPHERETLQPLRVDLYMELDTRAAAQHQRMRDTVDYAAVAAQVTFILTACRFRLIETAALAIASFLLLPPTSGEARIRIDALRIKITKPVALGGKGIPSVEVRFEAHDFEPHTERSQFGLVDIVFEHRSFGIYRLNVDAKASIPLHVQREMQESELVLSQGLLCQGKPVAAGTVFEWPEGASHRYDNPTGQIQTLLCVETPRASAENELEVEGEAAELELVARPRAWTPGA